LKYGPTHLSLGQYSFENNVVNSVKAVQQKYSLESRLLPDLDTRYGLVEVDEGVSDREENRGVGCE
jgi:hypothetical protein